MPFAVADDNLDGHHIHAAADDRPAAVLDPPEGMRVRAERPPGSPDGVVAGAPVYSLVTQTSSIVRNLIFSAPGAAFCGQGQDQ